MINLKKKLTLFAFVTLALAILGASLRTVALFGSYDASIGYYSSSAILPKVFHLLTVGVLIIEAVLALLLPTSDKAEYAAPALGSTYVRVGSAFALCGMATYLFYLMLGALGDTAIYKKTNTSGMMELMALALGIIAIFYFVLILSAKTEKNNYYVAFAYVMVIFLLLAVSFTYFDYFTVMNGPNKILLQMTVLVVMFYTVTEQRFPIGRAKPRLYSFFALTAFYFCAVCSLPYIIAFFGGKVTNLPFLFYHFMIFGFGTYIATRTYSFIALQKS